MTNSERITAHNARLAAMKETVAGLPDAGGGGGVKTCTIRIGADIPTDYFPGFYVAVTQCIDGNFVPSAYFLRSSLLIIENVVCGSAVALADVEGYSHMARLSDNMNFLEWDAFLLENTSQLVAFNAPTEPNAVGELMLIW